MAFGAPETLDLFGRAKDQVDRPFVDAIRAAVAAAPQLQGAVDGLTGRVLRLTAEGTRLLRDHESMRGTVITGVVRSPETGKIAGHLTFIDPRGLAGPASSLPSIAGAAAMQLQLASIEKALDGLKRDLAHLIRHEHLKVESGIEANLRILGDVYATSRRRGSVEDDQWDRIANIEHSVRSLHLESAKHLRTLEDALDGASLRLPERIARYLSVGGTISRLTDRIRLVRQSKLTSLLRELDELLAVFSAELAPAGGFGRKAIPLGGRHPR